MIGICISILREKIYSIILRSINKSLIRLAQITTIKQSQGFSTYSKNMNYNSDISRHI